MVEVNELVHSTLDAVKGNVYKRIIYPVSQRGYEHLQRGIGSRVRDEGMTLSQAVDAEYDRMDARLQLIPDNPATIDAIRNGAGIFVGNNQDPGSNFTFLRALKDRPSNDVSFVEKSTNVPYWDESIRDHILPVYINFSPYRKIGYIAEKTKNSPGYEDVQKLTPDEQRERNNHSMATAATSVAEGGIVIIFPSGVGDEAVWKRGVGDIVQQLGDRRSDAQLIMGYTQGTSPWDKYRLAPGIRRVKPVKVNMYVSAVSLKTLLEGLHEGADSKEIANYLRQNYINWVNGKKVQEKSEIVNRRPML